MLRSTGLDRLRRFAQLFIALQNQLAPGDLRTLRDELGNAVLIAKLHTSPTRLPTAWGGEPRARPLLAHLRLGR